MGDQIGARVRRKEDPRLIRGEGRYVADITPPGCLHAAVVRSPYAHAHVLSIDCSRALAHPDVVDVLLPDDVAGVERIPVRVGAQLTTLGPFLQPHLAQGKVRYVGEPIVVVVASDRYKAEDALELVEIEYEPLDAVTDGEAALEAGAPILVEEVGTNIAAAFSTPPIGDVEAAFAEATVVVGDTFQIQRHAAVPMETRGLVARFDPQDGRLTVWGPTKVPHANRNLLALFMGISEDLIRFVEPDVGGGFGTRGEFYPEDFLIPFLAYRLRRPVKWIEDRREHLISANQSRDERYEAEMAFAADGRILGLRAKLIHNTGAYVRTHGVRVAEIAINNFAGPYKMPSYHADVLSVVTNTTPTGTYRAPGRFESSFTRERLLEMGARALGLDPAELRRRNLVREDEMPYDVGTMNLDEPLTIDSGDPPAIFARALELIGYDGFRERQAQALAQGRRLGIAAAAYTEESGLGGPGGTPGEYARVVVGNSGDVTVYSGVAALGQGLETTLAQVCAEELGIGYEQVTVVHGDTDRVPFGGGTWASRGAIIGGNAVSRAAQGVRGKLAAAAAAFFEANSDDLEVAGGVVRAKDDPSRAVAWADLVRATYGKQLAAEGIEPGIEETSVFHAPRMTHAPGADAVIVEVDPETGVVTILEHVVVYDIGRALNPLIVEGQLQGGAVQGIGGVLLEHFAYDESGQPLATSFMGYLLPSALDTPHEAIVEIREDHRSPLNPLGVKGAGDAGPAGASATLPNAVADAFSELDLQINRLPLTPDSVLAWIREAAAVPAPS